MYSFALSRAIAYGSSRYACGWQRVLTAAEINVFVEPLRSASYYDSESQFARRLLLIRVVTARSIAAHFASFDRLHGEGCAPSAASAASASSSCNPYFRRDARSIRLERPAWRCGALRGRRERQYSRGTGAVPSRSTMSQPHRLHAPAEVAAPSPMWRRELSPPNDRDVAPVARSFIDIDLVYF